MPFYNTETDIGRLLSELKFCAVDILMNNGERFTATRCPLFIKFDEHDGISGNFITMMKIKKGSHDEPIKDCEITIDFNDIKMYIMTKIGKQSYLDSNTSYD